MAGKPLANQIIDVRYFTGNKSRITNANPDSLLFHLGKKSYRQRKPSNNISINFNCVIHFVEISIRLYHEL